MAVLPIQEVMNPTFVAAAASGGDRYPNSGSEFLLLALPANRTLTVHSPHAEHADFTQLFVDASIITPKFDPLWWNDSITGEIHFEFDDPTGVMVAAVRLSVIAADPNAAPLASLL